MVTTAKGSGCDAFHAFNTGWAAGYYGADYAKHLTTVVKTLGRPLTVREQDEVAKGYKHGKLDRDDFNRRMREPGSAAVSDASYMKVPMVMAQVPEAPPGALVTWAGVNIWGATPHFEIWARKGDTIYVTEFKGDGQWTDWHENGSAM